MQKINRQATMKVAYDDVCQTMEDDKPKLLNLLKAHINLSEYIPERFYQAFYKSIGRPRDYSLESLIWFTQLQNIIGIPSDKAFLTVLSLSKELREFCGFTKVPHASEITRFRQTFAEYIGMMFDNLVEITEPICRMIDPKKADYLLYDTTGIEANVKENNPKFLSSKLTCAKKASKNNPELNPYSYVYSLLPETAEANPFVKQQYINGHFCYVHKVGILTNGIGIVRGIYPFDERFKATHPEVISKKTANPDIDKEIGDSTSLKPILSDFFDAHPTLSYKTFIADSSFDSYDNYCLLRDDFHFDRMAIPINSRNSSSAHADFDDNGTPLCPIDKSPFTFIAISRGTNRSERFKWVCHKSIRPYGSSTRICSCYSPCTNSPYGRTVYTYPSKNLRFYPGIPRGTDHWNNLFRHRTLIERTINIFKLDFGVALRRSFSQATSKADLFLAGISQLLGVILAFAINKRHLFKSIRKLVSA